MKRIALILSILLFMQPIIAVSQASAAEQGGSNPSDFELTPEDRAVLQNLKDTEISVGYYVSLAYYQDSQGKEAGILMPLINLLRSWGLTVKPVKMVELGADNAWADDSVDLYGTASLAKKATEGRPSTDAFYANGMLSITPQYKGISDLTEVAGKKLGLLSEPAVREAIDPYLEGNETIEVYSTIEDMLDAMDRGDIEVALTSMYAQGDVARHKGLSYLTLRGSVPFKKGVIGRDASMQPLIDLIDRYLKSAEGEQLSIGTQKAVDLALVNQVQESLGTEIAYIQQHYDSIKAIGSECLYPFCYMENGEFKGIAAEEAKLFTDVTGVKVEMESSEEGTDADDIASLLDSGQVNIIAGVYRSDAFGSNGGYSSPIYRDKVMLYMRDGDDLSGKDESDLTTGTTVDFLPYIDWQTYSGGEPTPYLNEKQALEALDSGEVDLALISRMAVDYDSVVLNENDHKRFDASEVDVSLRLLFSPTNPPELNRAIDAVASLYSSSYAYTAAEWNKLAVDYRQEYIDAETNRQQQMVVFVVVLTCLSALLIVFLIAAIRQYRKYSKYDIMVKELLSHQDSIDVGFGDFKSNTLTSKGGWQLLYKAGCDVPESATLSFDELNDILGTDFKAFYKSQFDDMVAKGEQVRVVERRIRCKKAELLIRQHMRIIDSHRFSFYAIDITQEKLVEENLRYLANYDHLTKVLRRRAFIEEADRVRATATSELFVIMFDIDFFKRVNDSYGHEIGDRVLQMVSGRLDSFFSGDGLVGRWGGEEFSVLIEGDPLGMAVERVRTAIDDIGGQRVVVDEEAGRSVSVTISAGLSSWTAGETLEEAMSRADQALYAAKNSGRNHLEILVEGMAEPARPSF